MNEANSLFSSTAELSAHLTKLREDRLIQKTLRPTESRRRQQLTPSEKKEVLKKTGSHCHICGGKLSEKWHANHIVAHAYGGTHSADNFLPAHVTCNRARWFYGSEEFQWIIKMGVYFRTQLEEEGNPYALALAQGFVEHEQRKVARRKGPRVLEPNVVDVGTSKRPNVLPVASDEINA